MKPTKTTTKAALLLAKRKRKSPWGTSKTKVHSTRGAASTIVRG